MEVGYQRGWRCGGASRGHRVESTSIERKEKSGARVAPCAAGEVKRWMPYALLAGFMQSMVWGGTGHRPVGPGYQPGQVVQQKSTVWCCHALPGTRRQVAAENGRVARSTRNQLHGVGLEPPAHQAQSAKGHAQHRQRHPTIGNRLRVSNERRILEPKYTAVSGDCVA